MVEHRYKITRVAYTIESSGLFSADKVYPSIVELERALNEFCETADHGPNDWEIATMVSIPEYERRSEGEMVPTFINLVAIFRRTTDSPVQ